MTTSWLNTPIRRPGWLSLLISAFVLVFAFLLGYSASFLWLGLLSALFGGLVLLLRPSLGLFAVLVAALFAPLEISTGTEVSLNPVTLLIPVVAAIWLLDRIRHHNLRLVSSPSIKPLILFLGASLLSLAIGQATWEPLVPVGGNFLLVQLAQWAIFVFSALAFWLTGNLIKDELTLWRLTAFFLVVGGGAAIGYMLLGAGGLPSRLTTIAFIRAPLWALLVALAGGQLLWNHTLPNRSRALLATFLLACVYYAIFQNRDASSTWVGIGATLGTLVWLRSPRLPWLVALSLLGLILSNTLFPSIWEFAGGDDAWFSTGGSRLALIERVIDVTARNPITGLGPAAYRPYASARPLVYAHIYWANPRVNSHNNYVDLFAHGGLLGLALFGWFALEIARLGIRLRQRYSSGFKAAYVNSMLALGVSSLVLMAFADWILPFVYNIGFPGFQASVLVWLFLGGLVALDGMNDRPDGVATAARPVQDDQQ